MFTGLAGAALLKVLEALFNAFGTGFNDWLARKRAENNLHDLGRAETTSTINKESADAERRANEVAVNRPDVDDVIAGLQRGDRF
ncbi:hypothetical protein RPMA_18265 [Tardiphaga alba]|uniref:Uncharacterized protein n=1 Tax=Tardiphaga alba TaxID=340268 RepID=A0ABX8ADR5_9BRAD|nr:hypothetical protein [Tardiphaga alba]QUS40563.1 hypothetical protein RPMA_18265 [Tardiphaga alba]